MRKITIFTTIAASILATSDLAFAQMLEPRSMELMDSQLMTDRFISKMPDTIECINVVALQRHDRRDLKTTQATYQKHIYRLTNMNLKFTGGYMFSDTDTSVAVYSLTSGGSDMNIMVGIDTFRAKVLAVVPPLPQPNTCQVGMEVVKF